ncbi:hypothetical protein [Streptomyces sp. MNU76]|uniref:hypothetical protein n=1 Tax=Streptomyces sp. MNU76 TaxID=2560026 RepID=UPI0027DF809B|nr:hypothetical protein [Streptomyces sp. MNU76]
MTGQEVHPEHLGDLRADLLDRVEADTWVLRDQADTPPSHLPPRPLPEPGLLLTPPRSRRPGGSERPLVPS